MILQYSSLGESPIETDLYTIIVAYFYHIIISCDLLQTTQLLSAWLHLPVPRQDSWVSISGRKL